MGILNVDNIQPVGGGTTITLNSSEINVGAGITFESNGQANFAGIVTATSFVGDGSGLTGAGPTLTNGSNNRVVTATGANGINGEANLTFDGDNLTITGSNHVTQVLKAGGATSDLHIDFKDSSNNLEARIFCASDQGDLRFYTGGANERLRIGSSGQIGLSGANYGTSGQVLTSQGSGSAPTWATPSGLSMADQWRFKATQNITGSRQLLTGWERPDRSGTGGGAYVGSGMSVSSDIFSFPVTGIYLITLDWSINCSSNNVRYAKSEIEVTKNNSDYYQAAKAFIHINRPTGTSTGHTTSCNFIIDVDNTTNDKVKFTSSIDNVGDHQVLGDEDVNVTTVTFLRLGDT